MSSNTMALSGTWGVARDQSLCSPPPSVYCPTHQIVEQWRFYNQVEGEFANLRGFMTWALLVN